MTDSVRLFVHEPTRTLVRCMDGHVQLIREGREVASEYGSATISDALGLAEDGTLFLGEQGFFDLHAPTLRRRNWDGLASYGSRTLHPKGQVALVLTRAPVDDPSTYGPVRETHARVQPDSFQLVRADATWHEGPLVLRSVPEPPKTRRFESKTGADVARASPEDRVTLAGELLDRRESHPVFVPLVQAYPESFHPHLARVLACPNEWKALLKELGWRRWSEIARGASDPLVDAMAETTRRLGGRAPELELLLAADTPRALMRLADLSRELPHVHEIATKRGCLEIPARGPAVRRFDPNQRVLHAVPRSAAPRAGALQLDTGLKPEAWLEEPRGIRCLLPPTHLVRVPLELVHCDSPCRLEAFHFASSSCQESGCDEWAAHYEARAGEQPRRLLLIADRLERETMMDPSICCTGDAEELPEPMRVELSPFDPAADSSTELGRIGGRPEWTQSPQVPHCPKCRRAMFFVGQIDTAMLKILFLDLFAFVCERCAITVQIRQNT
ncbi:hypothetical protein F0U59_38655 [Archangium gephyra]|nr:hypothetical protein F0U59_38655 [Archangium gephyra]